MVFGTTCPFFGTFSKEGELIPSQELANLCQVDVEEQADPKEYPPLNLGLIAKECRYTEPVVSKILNLIFATCKQVIKKRWFQKIKLQFTPTHSLIMQKGYCAMQTTSAHGDKESVKDMNMRTTATTPTRTRLSAFNTLGRTRKDTQSVINLNSQELTQAKR